MKVLALFTASLRKTNYEPRGLDNTEMKSTSHGDALQEDYEYVISVDKSLPAT